MSEQVSEGEDRTDTAIVQTLPVRESSHLTAYMAHEGASSGSRGRTAGAAGIINARHARRPGEPVKQQVTLAGSPGLERHPGDNPDRSFLGHVYKGHQESGQRSSSGLRKKTTDTYFHGMLRQGAGQAAKPQRSMVLLPSVHIR